MVFHPPPSDDELRKAVQSFREHGGKANLAAARAAGMRSSSSLEARLRLAAKRGLMLDERPVMPGFEITEVTTDPKGGQFTKQKVEPGAPLEIPDGLKVTGLSAYTDSDMRVHRQWVIAREDRDRTREIAQAMIEAFKEELPRAEPTLPIPAANADLLNQYTITDLHMGMLAWGEETGADWDLKIAERLILSWFAAAIQMSPAAAMAVLANIGDLLHHDAKSSVTPASGHVLDADSRLQKMIRVAIRVIRQVVRMLLDKHERVHIIMADANHDEAGSAWMRELLSALYEDEPRVTVDTSPSTYYAVEHGLTSLFYHHGHKKNIKQVDSVFAGKFREIYGRTKFAYGHTGHLHSDELISTNLMKVERHETLSAPDAYAANGGWLSGRSAKVITYSKRFGEVGRITLTPEMVLDTEPAA